MLHFRVSTYASGCLLLCLLAMALLSIFVHPCAAQTSVTINAERQFQYAEQLFSQKKYVLAIMEYERFVHFFHEDGRVPEARYHMGLAYFSERRYPEAIQAFKELIENTRAGSTYYARSFFMAADSQLRMGRQSSAMATLGNLANLSDDVNVRDEANYRMGWILLEIADWEKAQTYFHKIS